MLESYKSLKHILVELTEDNILIVRFNRPQVLNAANVELHKEMSEVFKIFDKDDDAKVAVVTGVGKGFSAGGDKQMIIEMTQNYDLVIEELYDTRNIVTAIIDTEKPIISAINGAAVGAGLAVALLADISVIGKNVRISDGHLRFGVVPGDHSLLLWPLLTSIAKMKYYLLTSDFITGEEAERIGLVSLAVDDSSVMDKAMEIAKKLSSGPQLATRLTKRAINSYVKNNVLSFENSLALEMLTFLSREAKEGAKALIEKRNPNFDN